MCREHVFKGNKRAGNIHLEIKCAENSSLKEQVCREQVFRKQLYREQVFGEKCAGNIYLGIKCAGHRYVLGVREQELRD